MKKTYYYILSMLIVLLLFSSNNIVHAETTEVQATIPVSSGSNLYAYTQSYTNILGKNLTTEGNEPGSDTYLEFDPTYNIVLTGVDQNYLNGYLILTINISASVPNAINWTYEGIDYQRPYNDDGLKVFIGLNNYNFFRVLIIFDNYSNPGNQIDLGTFTPKYVAKIGDVTPLKANFTTSFSIYSNHLQKDTYIQNDRTTELIYNAIYQATGQQLLNILNTLTAINTQDYTYYTQLISKLNQLHTDNTQQHTDLINILNELDLDFQQVQTILDLFPSYRTQVLQYWQQLLEMNAAQSQAAAEAASVAADKDNQSQQLINGMGSVVMPSLASGDLDILGGVDTTQKTNFFGLIGLITHTEIITKIMLIIVIGAIVGYVLYGKK